MVVYNVVCCFINPWKTVPQSLAQKNVAISELGAALSIIAISHCCNNSSNNNSNNLVVIIVVIIVVINKIIIIIVIVITPF